MASTPTASRPGPIDPRARLQSIDAVRGFALFGVLLVNMFNFGADAPGWTDPVDRVFTTLMHSVFETKSWRLFSLLFGFGFALQMARIASQPGGSMWFYFRRLLVLFVFGMGHALFFDGDVLMQYALLGLILCLFRSIRDRTLLILTCVLLAAFPVANLVDPIDEDAVELKVDNALPLEELRAGHPYMGSLLDVFEENVLVIPPRIWSKPGDPESSLAVFAMFLLGLCVGRARILHDATVHLSLIRKIFSWGIGVGVVSALIEWWLTQTFGYAAFAQNTASRGIRLAGDILFAYGSTALALGYGAGIVLLARRPEWRAALQPFQTLGRVGLTVYLLGTLMFTTLFYGYGFGQLYLLGPGATTLYAIVFFALLLCLCAWWLNRFKFGPAEWLWRSLTYGEVQPWRL